MATPTASRTVPARDDKAFDRPIAQIVESIDTGNDFIDLMKESAGKAPLQKEMAELNKRLKVAGEQTDKAKAGKELATLTSAAKAFANRCSEAARSELLVRQYTELRAKA